MKALEIKYLESWYSKNFEKKIGGRRILVSDIEPLILKLPTIFKKEIIGISEKGLPIYKISIGSGPKKVLAWSQMHGNESTGTKALFDLFNFFQSEETVLRPIISKILTNCTMQFITILNPDGAVNFTRENANGIDLNRDAVNRSAVESTILRNELDLFKPNFCFNLHDQRNIFNVQGMSNPATISFLAPSEDAERTVTKGRKETMSVIVAMNKLLQQLIPNHIGRYTDEFYPSATGDNFQKLGYNTILIEAGHYKNDYDRDVVRKFNCFALIKGLYFIATTNSFSNYKPYFDIPNNDKKFLDIIYKNVIDENKTTVDVGIQIKYELKNNKLTRVKLIENVGDLSNFHSYNCINAEYLNINELKL